MTTSAVKGYVEKLRAVRNEASAPWEQTLVDIGLSVLTTGGASAVQGLESSLASFSQRKLSREALTDLIGKQLSLRDASNFLAVLENGEADRVERSRELLRKVLTVASTVAEELLKAALGGLL